MQIAQEEASGIASGMPGHWRPNNLTLGQWLMSLGYPLSGDLYQDGYRSENWILGRNSQGAVQAWLGSSANDWEMQVPFFSKQFQTIAFDLRGRGQSQ